MGLTGTVSGFQPDITVGAEGLASASMGPVASSPECAKHVLDAVAATSSCRKAASRGFRYLFPGGKQVGNTIRRLRDKKSGHCPAALINSKQPAGSPPMRFRTDRPFLRAADLCFYFIANVGNFVVRVGNVKTPYPVTSSVTVFTLAEFGPAIISKLPGSTTRFMSIFHI